MYNSTITQRQLESVVMERVVQYGSMVLSIDTSTDLSMALQEVEPKYVGQGGLLP